jgi:hypothetical protein
VTAQEEGVKKWINRARRQLSGAWRETLNSPALDRARENAATTKSAVSCDPEQNIRKRRGFTDRASYGGCFSVPETRPGFAKLAADTGDSTCISAAARTRDWREGWIARGGGITATGLQVVRTSSRTRWFSFLFPFFFSLFFLCARFAHKARKPRIRRVRRETWPSGEKTKVSARLPPRDA